MGRVIIDYFTILFSKSVSSYESILDGVDARASSKANARLIAPFTANKFKRAIF